MELNYWLILGLAVMAFLYSSVGHGGASGYLAIMALFGVAPQMMKSSALILNVFVSLIAFYNFYNKKTFNWKLFIPLILTSIPMAYIGAQTPISDSIYKKILAACLIISIIRLVYMPKQSENINESQPIYIKLIIGGIIGLLSGMLGIGGGILLSPILLFLNWAKMKEIAAISALFIFVNSMSGLISLFSKGYTPNSNTFYWIGAAIIGGLLGGFLGSKKYDFKTLRLVLALVLVIACVKLVA
jgi:uncharacterized protein